MSRNTALNASPFDVIRHTDERGEYWSARELMLLLGYKHWTQFAKIVKKVELAIGSGGTAASHHIRKVSRMVIIGNGAKRDTTEYRLSRHACNLVAMNGNPRKPTVAVAQGYFVAMTIRAEQSGLRRGGTA